MSDEDSSSASDFGDNCNMRNGNFLCGVVEGFYGRPWTPDQRKDLFIKMNKFGINTYLYAPKDDCKHRAFWRDLYSVEEAEQLTSLIVSAKANNVIFYYALSPGLDMTYSSAKEVNFLKRKLEQVSQFGCTAFALLFDDIEPDMCEADKEIFQSFAHAQVSVTNEVYQHLGQPQFLFCPTEYCASRAIPNVQNSEYLQTIGSKLLPGIDVMWTGSKVISKVITVQSIRELTDVLKRPPVIWDNIHANDYDQKRLYLGPFAGRSPDLIPHLRGLLTNPNCEYEANFIAIHTLAQWSRCSIDGKRDLSINNSVSADIRLETESDNGSVEDIPSQISSVSYHPRNALKAAVKDWLPEFYRPKSSHGRLIKPQLLSDSVLPTINSCISVTTTTITSSSMGSSCPPLEVTESSNFQPLMNPVMNSLLTATELVSTTVEEPMDCVPTPSSSPSLASERPIIRSDIDGTERTDNKPQDEESRMQTDLLDNDTKLLADDVKTVNSSSSSSTSSSSSSSEFPPIASSTVDKLIADDVALLVDLFHLPFEHGSKGLQLLQEFNWLKNNAHLVVNTKKARTSTSKIEVQEWYDRAAKFDSLTQAVCNLCDRLMMCPNRSLQHDLYAYTWDMCGVVSLLNSYVKWLALGHVPQTVANYIQGPYTWFSQGWKEAFMSGEQEPWVFRGGLSAELQRLLPLENIADLYVWKTPDYPCKKKYEVRPYTHADRSLVYSICLQTCDDGLDGTEVFPDQPELIGDKLVGGFLVLSQEFCFVAEEDGCVCGYALGALDAKQFYNKMNIAYLPDLCTKYPQRGKDSQDLPTPAEEVIAGFHDSKPYVPEVVYKNHPSLIKLNVLQSLTDFSLVKKMLICTLAALKSNGSFGVFSEINVGDKNMVDFYSKLGFLEISLGSEAREEILYFGRTF